jgi:hypothetical protein
MAAAVRFCDARLKSGVCQRQCWHWRRRLHPHWCVGRCRVFVPKPAALVREPAAAQQSGQSRGSESIPSSW